MCLHGALCSVSFNLICNLTTFRKECVYLLTSPLGPSVCVCVSKDRICACMVLYVPFPLI